MPEEYLDTVNNEEQPGEKKHVVIEVQCYKNMPNIRYKANELSSTKRCLWYHSHFAMICGKIHLIFKYMQIIHKTLNIQCVALQTLRGNFFLKESLIVPAQNAKEFDHCIFLVIYEKRTE